MRVIASEPQTRARGIEEVRHCLCKLSSHQDAYSSIGQRDDQASDHITE